VNINNIGNSWQHNPTHRQGVRYGNANVAQRFGNNNIRSGSAQRMDFRGRDGQQVLNPGGDRGNRGDRGTANRPGGDRGAANRPGGDRGATNRQGGNRSAANRQGGNRSAANRPGGDRGGANRSGAARQRAGAAPRGGGARDNAFGNINRGQMARMHSARGQASLGGGARFSGGGGFGGGGFRGGGGGFRGGGGGGFRGGGGRRSDIALKHDVVLLGHLDSGVGFYRFSYVGSDKTYVGVIAQEVAAAMPQAVTRGRDGYLRVFYDRLGVKFQSYDAWIASGARVPAGVRIH
jgi:hypothetical protein